MYPACGPHALGPSNTSLLPLHTVPFPSENFPPKLCNFDHLQLPNMINVSVR
jgi:hypothetical protein